MQSSSLKTPPNDQDHTLGSIHAPVVLVEYGDYQCPYCASFNDVVIRLKEEFKDLFGMVYRHFPLADIHANAVPAARVAEAAHLQGKFWPMHHALYENFRKLDNDKIFEIAQNLGLKIQQFRKDFARKDLLERIQTVVHDGIESGVDGTPTLYLNGVLYEDSRNFEALKSAIQTNLDMQRNAPARENCNESRA